MTRISGLGQGLPVRSSGTAVKPGSGGFVIRSAATVSAPSVAAVTPAGLIALQEDDSPYVRDRAARRGGEVVLGALGRLQAASLDDDSGDALAVLNAAVGQMTEPADPILRGIIGAIRLRARVELARRERM